MKVHLGIPFWGDQKERVRNKDATTSYLSGLLNDRYFYQCTGSSPGITERGAARNDIVRKAIGWDADVVVLADADCWPEKDALYSAIEAAYSQGGMHFAFSHYRELTRKATGWWLNGDQERALQNLHMDCLGSVGGLIVIRPRDWARAGWSPELEGWGFEDVIFGEQCRAFLGDNVWHSGWLTHLYHPSEVRVGSESWQRNIHICKQFEAVNADPLKMKNLIKSGIAGHPGWTYWDDLNL